MLGVTDLLECFYLLLSDEFYDQLLVETNCYAIQQERKIILLIHGIQLPKKIL